MGRKMNQIVCLLILLTSVFSCKSQSDRSSSPLVGGPCEGCEAIYEYEDKILTAVDTLPGFQDTEPKLKIMGTVYHKDGKTPAKDVILYIYHTNRQGVYETNGTESGWARRHGFIRGWIKTSRDGKYAFYTFRPASYPNRRAPEHVHITVKEPDRNEYYIDEFVFDDDPLLTASERNNRNNRGGSGVVNPYVEDSLLTVSRDIILGLNIPDYD